MMEFDDFSDKKTKTDKILEKREKIKNQLAGKLEKLNFSETQIEDVIEIIDIAEAEIAKIKSNLNGTNINNPDPTPIMKAAFSEIKMRELQMGIDIRKKIDEIMQYNSKKNM